MDKGLCIHTNVCVPLTTSTISTHTQIHTTQTHTTYQTLMYHADKDNPDEGDRVDYDLDQFSALMVSVVDDRLHKIRPTVAHPGAYTKRGWDEPRAAPCYFIDFVLPPPH